MRHVKPLVALLATGALLAACGGSGGDAASGGGTTPATLVLPQGTIAGAPFAPVDGVAVPYAPATCTVFVAPESYSGLMLAFTSLPGTCGMLNAVGVCNAKANLSNVHVFIEGGNDNATTKAISPGTYFVSSTWSAPDAAGNVWFLDSGVGKSNASCVNSTATADLDATSVVIIESVTSTRVKGGLALDYSDGSTFRGSFDLPVCATTFGLCDVLKPTCSGSTCVP